MYCLSVGPSQKLKRGSTDAMLENNENLLAGAWWVILNSLDFVYLCKGKTWMK